MLFRSLHRAALTRASILSDVAICLTSSVIAGERRPSSHLFYCLTYHHWSRPFVPAPLPCALVPSLKAHRSPTQLRRRRVLWNRRRRSTSRSGDGAAAATTVQQQRRQFGASQARVSYYRYSLCMYYACLGIAPVASLPPPRFHRLASLASLPSPRFPHLAALASTHPSRRRPSRRCAPVAAQAMPPCHHLSQSHCPSRLRAAGRADARGDATRLVSTRRRRLSPRPSPRPRSAAAPAAKPRTPPVSHRTHRRRRPIPRPIPRPAAAPADVTAQATGATRKPPHEPPPPPRCDHPVFLNTLPRVGPCSPRAGYVSGEAHTNRGEQSTCMLFELCWRILQHAPWPPP